MKVNEIFGPTFQGEGKSAGKKVMFLRLAFCNLSCIWCDTAYTWDFKHYNKKKEITEMSNQEILLKIGDLTKALVISGGEPLLQQNSLISLCSILKNQGFWIEVETNGTIIPDDNFIELVNQFNISPKLSNSGNRWQKRENIIALTKFVSLKKSTWKFVVQDFSDISEILKFIAKVNIKKEIYLMPEGKTKIEQLQRQKFVKNICKHFGFNFSPRLQVLKYGTRRAV